MFLSSVWASKWFQRHRKRQLLLCIRLHPLSSFTSYHPPHEETLTLFTLLSRYITRENSPSKKIRQELVGLQVMATKRKDPLFPLHLPRSLSLSVSHHQQISLMDGASLTWTFLRVYQFRLALGSRIGSFFLFEGSEEECGIWTNKLRREAFIVVGFFGSQKS